MSAVLLSGKSSTRSKHVYYYGQPMAYRSGDYRIHFLTRERTRDPKPGKQEEFVRPVPALPFNLKDDISQNRDIAGEYPEIVERLTSEFQHATSAIKGWKRIQ